MIHFFLILIRSSKNLWIIFLVLGTKALGATGKKVPLGKKNVLLLCFVPQISTALPDLVMGPDLSR